METLGTLIVCALILFALVCAAVGFVDIVGLEKEDELIAACQKELPRNQHCVLRAVSVSPQGEVVK